MRIPTLLILLLCFCIACNESPTEKQASETTKEPVANSLAKNTESYPSLPLEIAQSLAQNTTYIDYLYYSLPISMSFNEPAGILTAIRHISDLPAPKLPNCKPIGRVTYQKDGDYLLEADIYFSQGCTFFVFFENNKPKYGNLMTADAVKFYQDMINRVQSQVGGQ